MPRPRGSLPTSILRLTFRVARSSTLTPSPWFVTYATPPRGKSAATAADATDRGKEQASQPANLIETSLVALRPQDRLIHIADVGAAAHRHRHIQFVANDVQAAGDARFAESAQAIQEGSADQGAPRAECDRFQHVLPRADAAVHPDLDPRADRIDDGRQCLDRAGSAVELAPAVI